jgi:hypothetical protein
MFGFLIKKSFWDLWDNMGRVLVVNLLFTLLLMGFIGTSYVAQYSLLFATILLLALVVASFIYLGTAAAYIKEISDFKAPELKSLFQNIKNTWRYSLGGGLVFSVVILLTVLGMRFYSSLGGILGMIGAIFLFWIFVTVILAVLYYFPVMNRLNSTFLKMIKKSFLIFLDNPFLTIGVFFGLIFNMVISIFTVLLIPGPAGALLWLDNNLRLLIYKYDYREENPDAGRKIPWRALFLEDNEKIGPRTFRNTIFPWK